MARVPEPSGLASSGEVALHFGDERAHDGQSQARATTRQSKSAGRPTPSSVISTRSQPSDHGRDDADLAAAVGQSVLDRVLAQLGDHHRQAGRELGRDLTETADPDGA